MTANLFAVLGATPIRGRVFNAREDVPNGPRSPSSNYGLWQRRYGTDVDGGPDHQIGGAPHEVVGIMPAFVLPTDFQNPAPTVLWTPSGWDSGSTDHGNHGYYAAAL